MENLSVGRSASLSGSVSVLGGTQRLAQETNGKPKIERVAHQQIQMPALPMPDYETLFPKKRHGVMGQTRWDHIIAEVNQRRLDRAPKCSGSEMSADSHDESKVTCQPLVPHQTTLAQQESLGEGSGSNTTGPSTENVLQLPKPILSDEKFDVRPKQALQPPKPVNRDKVVCPNTKQTPQPLKLVSPRQTVAVPTMTDNASASPSGEKPLKAPNSLLFSALENVQKRNIRYTKPQEYAGNEKVALGSVSEPCHPWVTPATEVPDTNTAGVSNTQEELCVNSRPTIPTRKPKKKVRNQQSECAPATLKEMVSNSDRQSSKNHSENTAGSNSDGIQKVFEEDPFPTNQLFSHDPWQLPQESTNDEIFLMKDTILSDCLTRCPKQNKSEGIISLPPQVTKKKRQAPLPPVTSTSLSIVAKRDKHTTESCEELRSDVEIKEDISRSVLENNVSSVNNEQRRAEDLGISSAAFNKTVYTESSSKQQLIKPKHSPVSSAEKLPQAASGILKLALENAQKRNTDVNKTVVTSRLSDTKSEDMDEQAGSAEKTSKVVTPTPQIIPKKRRAPHPPGPSSSFSSKAKPESEIEAKDGILTKNSCLSIHNEQRRAENKDMPTDSVVTCTKTATFPETSSKQKVEVEHSQTSQSQHKEPEGTKHDDVSQSVIEPTTEALEEDRPKESIEAHQMQNVSKAAEAQKDTTLKLDPFANSEITLKDSLNPWKIPEQAKTDDCQVTDEGKAKNTKLDNGCLTPNDFDNIFVSNVPADTFSDSCFQKFSEKDKNVTVIDGSVPVPQILLKETLPAVSSSSLGNSGLSSDEQASEPDLSPDAVLLKATVIITPSEEPVKTEPLDTSTAFQWEKAKEVSTLDHKKGVTQITEKMQKETEVIPMDDDQHATLCQMASLEQMPDVDTENMIECDPSRDVLLSSDSRNFLQLNKNDDDLAHNTKEDVITEETGLSQNELNRNHHSDIPTDLLSTSCTYAALSCERKTVEVIRDINVSPAILSNQDSLHHEGLNTNTESKPGTQEISSDASKQDADPWKESLSSAIIITSVKDTPTDLSRTQQDNTSSIPPQTLICPSVEHLSPMSSEIKESVSNTNIQENSAGPVSHLVKLKSSFNTLQTLHSYESGYASGRQELLDANTSGKSPSAPAMLTSDAPWERDSDESLICTSAGEVTEDSQSDFARSPQQNTQENYILRTISQSAQVPALNISSTSQGSSSAPEPGDWRTTLPREAFLHPILEEDIPVVRDKENQWGENHFPTCFYSKSTFQSMSTKETGRTEQFGHFSPMSAGPKYARISPLEVQAVLPDDIGPPLASSPLR